MVRSGPPRCREESRRAPPRDLGQQPPPPQQPQTWKPTLLRAGCRPPPLSETSSAPQGTELWPLPCSVAANPVRSSEAQVKQQQQQPSGPRRRRKYTLLQGVWSDTREHIELETAARQEEQESSANLFGVTAPALVPAGMRVVKVDATVDSGAEAVVAPKGVIPGSLAPSEMSKNGKVYRAANGSKIANFGQTRADFRTKEGHNCQLLFQVADVERVLVGVTPLTESGHEVKLGKFGGEILHVSSGRRIALQRRGGVYHLSMYFLIPDGDPGAVHAQDFPRQGR